MSMNWLDVHKLRLGGPVDTWVLLIGVAVPVVYSSPYFAEQEIWPVFFLALIAGSHFGYRIMTSWREKATLASNISIKSVELPFQVKDGETPANGLLIGYCAKTGKPFWLPDEDFMRHGFLIGQSGVGKTVLGRFMMFQHIQRGGGLLFIDGKLSKEELETIHRYCVWAGREQDLLVINPGSPEESNSYNPILYGDPDEVSSRILSLIPATENSPGADHYKSAANQGLATLVSALQWAGLSYNFIDLTILLMNQKALADLERRCPPGAPKTNLSLFLDQWRIVDKDGKSVIDVKRMKETFGGIGGRMFMFGTGQFGSTMNTYTPDVDLYKSIIQNKIVYVALPTMGKNEAAQNLGKMIIGDLRTAVSWVQRLKEEDKPNPPFFVFMDEFGSYAVASVARVFEQARTAHIALLPAVQTIANLQAVSDELSEMVIGNTWMKYYFKIGTQESALACAELIGMEKSIVKAIGLSDSRSESAPFINPADPNMNIGLGGGMTYTEREQEDYIVSAETIKALGKGECIITYGGDKIYHIKVPMILVEKDFAHFVGQVRYNRYRERKKIGIELFEKADYFLSKGDKEEMGKAGSTQDGEADESVRVESKPSGSGFRGGGWGKPKAKQPTGGRNGN